MRIYLLILFLIFSFGQLVPHGLDFLVAIGGVFGVYEVLRRSDREKRWLLVLGLWLVAVGVSLFFNWHNYTTDQLVKSSLYPLRWFAYAGFFFFAQNLKGDLKPYLKASILLITVIGLLQYIFLPDVSFLAASGWDDHFFRLTFPFLDPGFTGIILLLGILLFLDSPLVMIIFVAFLLTYSRASYLGYLVAFVILGVMRKSPKIFVVAALALFLFIPLLPTSSGEGTKLARENSIVARIKNWKESVAVWQSSPIVGVGFNAYRYKVGMEDQSHSGGADSSLLLVLATTGVLGGLGYLGVIREMWAMGRNDRIFAAFFGAVLAHSWFNNTLFYAPVMFLLWVLLGSIRKNLPAGRQVRGNT